MKCVSKILVLFLLFFSISNLSYASSETHSGTPEIYWGLLDANEQILIHNNGQVAWNGIVQTGTFNADNVFYHANGMIAWDGMKRTRNSWGDPSQKGIFYYDNGNIAWGGIQQKANSWGEIHQEGIFYHAEGEKLWAGLEQKVNTWGEIRNEAIFYHSNGTKAWEGLKKFGLYHSNGQLAWNCNQKSPVYDSNGKKITSVADYVYLHLGNNSWLYADHLGQSKLILNLGEGYQIIVENSQISLTVLGKHFNLDL